MGKIKKFLQWLLVFPLGYALLSVSGFIVFIGLSFLTEWLKGFSLFWSVIIAMGLFIPMLTLVVMILTSATAVVLYYLSPNLSAYWLLVMVCLGYGGCSVFQYCSAGAVGGTYGENLIQLPGWLYIVLYLLQAGIIIAMGLAKKDIDRKRP